MAVSVMRMLRNLRIKLKGSREFWSHVSDSSTAFGFGMTRRRDTSEIWRKP
jgi:hypothetical protein